VLIAVAVGLVLAFATAWGLADKLNPIWIAVLFALIVWKHRSNIARLAKGQEPKLTFGKR